MVAIWHSQLAVKLFQHTYLPFVPGSPPSIQNLLGRLDMGVDIFFCISGFIMVMLIESGRESGFSIFLSKRTIRIFPLYWIFTLAVVVAYLVDHKFNAAMFSGDSWDDLRHLVLSIFLIPHEKEPVLGVGWTLEQEILFYISIAVFLLFGWRKSLLASIFALSSVCIFLSVLGVEILYGKVFNVLYLEFLFGALVYKFRDCLIRINVGSFLFSGSVLYVVASIILSSGYIDSRSMSRALIGGSIGFCFLSAAICLEGKLSGDRWIEKIMRRLGDASYVIYLSHVLTLSMLGKVAVFFPDVSTGVIFLYHVFSIVAAIVLSVILHAQLERPLQKQLKILAVDGRS